MVVVSPVNLPVTRLYVEEIITECRQKRITKVDLLGFEFEMGLFPNVLDEAKSKGIDIAPKYIPADVFDKRAVEKNQVVFHDVAAIEVKPLLRPLAPLTPFAAPKAAHRFEIAVQLTDFSVYYSQDSTKAAHGVSARGRSLRSRLLGGPPWRWRFHYVFDVRDVVARHGQGEGVGNG